MIVDGNGKDALATVLADNILVQVFVDVLGFGQMLEVFALLLRPLLDHDLVAQFDTLVTNVNRGTSDKLLDFFLSFAAERTPVITSRYAFFSH
jgi:hypothetical protein